MVVLDVPVVVLAQSHGVLLVWLKVVVSVPIDKVRFPAGLARDDQGIEGKSAITSVRNVGVAADPLVGPARTRFSF